jgi:site-specific recombinase XerD
MDEKAFNLFLKRRGKKQHVVERNVRSVKKFSEYLYKERNKELEAAAVEDVEAYVEKIEGEKKSAKGPLYALMNYFASLKNDELLQCARSLRKERTKKTRRVFPIKKFLNIDQEHVKKLAKIGITNVEQMLNAGKTKSQREQLAEQLDIPEEAILELVNLSDLTRIGYVKAKLTRLYYNAGLDSPQKVALYEPDDLHAFFVRFVEESGWDGMIPNPKDLRNNVKNAKKLKKIVEE